MKRKILSLLLGIVIVFTFAGCKNEESAKISVGAISSFEVCDYGENTVTLSWEKCNNANAYEIYIADQNGDKLYTTTAETTASVTGLEKNTEYVFKICGIFKNEENVIKGALAEITACTYCEKVGEVTSFLTSSQNLTLKWDRVLADGYEVYSYDDEAGKFLLENTVTENNCKIVNLKPETEYEFKIIPFKSYSIGKIYGQETFAKASTVGENDLSLTVENVTPNSYTIVWNEIEGVDGYDLYVFDEDKNEFEIFAENIADTRFDVTDLPELSSKTYAVMPYKMADDKKFSHEISTEIVATTNLSPTEVTLTAGEGSIKVLWEKLDKADGYTVLYSQSEEGDFSVATTFESADKTSFTINNLNYGEKYYVKVLPFSDIDGQKLYGEETVKNCTTKNKPQTSSSDSPSATTTTTAKKETTPTYNRKNFIDIQVSGSDFEPADKRWNDISKLVKNYAWSNTSSFALYDINSGVKITYNGDWYVATASTVKAPYIMYVLSQEIDKGNAKLSDKLTYERRFYSNGSGQIKYSSYGTKYTIKEVIHLILETSDNCGFLMLQDHFGVKNYNKWLESIGCKTFIDGVNVKWGSVSANDSCRIWQEIYKYFSNGKNGEFFKKELLGTGYSPIRKNLGDKYKVANKFGGADIGWHDTGVVFAGKNPYILILLTNDSYMHADYYFQNNMIKQLDGLHDELVKYLKEQKEKEEQKPVTTTKPATTTTKPTTTTPTVTTTAPTTTTPPTTTTTVVTTEIPTVSTTDIPTTTTPEISEESQTTTAVESETVTEEITSISEEQKMQN